MYEVGEMPKYHPTHLGGSFFGNIEIRVSLEEMSPKGFLFCLKP